MRAFEGKGSSSGTPLSKAVPLVFTGTASTTVALGAVVAHRAEIGRVLVRLNPEVDLRVATYQTLFSALHAEPTLARDYVDYLDRRYFA